MMFPLYVALPLGAIFGAICRRLAGGLLTQWLPALSAGGTTMNRVAWAVMSAIAVCAAGLWWAYSLAFGLTIFAGSTVGYGLPWKGNTESTLRMGRSVAGAFTWPQYAGDFALMSAHGLAGVGLAAAGAWWLAYPDWWLLLGAGATAAPLYSLAWLWAWNIPWLGCLNDPSHGLVAPGPTAELMWGGVVGAAAVCVVMLS